ncbi:endonuclease/exonuclease/phosphatase family protein [Thalassotalea hakodatensis]|uniref:endonuclease/exonuclease/phosphatase family protein n=1 Tax=Thalassotalea hakodatensis TaxID=3030492 RepID=UPI002573B752|nr:endonuclease/exonuclease/phosphatase family protein [Thalassotalea hakodatensis]
MVKNFLKIAFSVILLFVGFANGGEPEPIKIFSYNVYFDDETGAERYPTILNYIAKQSDDVVLLQECTPTFLSLLSREPRFNKYFIKHGNKQGGYTNIILTSLPIIAAGDIKLKTNMGRSAPYITFKDYDLSIVNVHLESGILD